MIGFCGQATGHWIDFVRRMLLNRSLWALYRFGLRTWEPAPFETTLFRKKILDRLEKSDLVATDFVRRRHYRAGYKAPKKDPFHPSRLEFVQNIINTDYTVCMRGGGNFSVRFYEAMSLGCIPVFVDTDCILPFEHLIDYRRYCVWVKQSEISYIAEKIADFHASLSNQDFRDLQIECRKLWLKYLSNDGFYRNFSCHFTG